MEKRNNLKIGIYILFFYFCCTLLPLQVLPFDCAGVDYTALPLWLRASYSFVFQLVELAIIMLLCHKQLEHDFIDLKKHHKQYFTKYFKYYFLLLGLMMISNLLITILTPNEIASNEEAIRKMFESVPLYTFIVSVFIAPFLEELVFRRAIHNIYSHKICFILISGLLFGSLHVITSLTSYWELIYIIPYSIPGFIFAYLLSETDNVLVPALMHFMHNGLLMSLQILLFLLA